MSSTHFLRALLAMALCLPGIASAFGFEDVVARARKLSTQPYEAPQNNLPGPLREIDYDAYRDIRFKPEKALWRGAKLPFELQFFHPGRQYQQSVTVNLISADGVRRLSYNPDSFDFGKNKFDPSSFGDVGYSGFRVHYPINKPDFKDEVMVFRGASYFRALGKHQRYGLSGRGLAIDTGLISGEEFPAFTEFWVVWPAPTSSSLEIYALLDSPRAAGAYRFVLQPGVNTKVDVEATLFMRDKVGKLGLAPLTSMYYYGENQTSPFEDFRPEVHDSDGLLVDDGSGEWVWRPLTNPKRLVSTSFGTETLKGFGLMQRDRDFASYQDLETRYDLRPSAWITPKGDWGKGRVELIMIPTKDETNDNVVAFWVPETQPRPGEAFQYAYRISFEHDELSGPELARVVQTRRGHGFRREPDDSLRMVVDFVGGPLANLAQAAKIDAPVWINDNGELMEKQLQPNPATGGWRLNLRYRVKDSGKPVEMRAALRDGDKPLSETWSYLLPAQ
ncbi:MAG: glucan biosynthesis protein G [Pseudomonadota bacterium]|jgi:periplasmic glucans biosynthesis protein|nr:glucan biosynthesis protein G [Pseudomonadota bacterium]